MALTADKSAQNRFRIRLLAAAAALAYVACVIGLQVMGYWRSFDARLKKRIRHPISSSSRSTTRPLRRLDAGRGHGDFTPTCLVR